MNKPGRPQPHESESFYHKYIALVPGEDPRPALEEDLENLRTAFLPYASRAGFRYAEGKWTVTEMLHHLIQAEYIFGYRLLRFAHGDDTPLTGFEENDYITRLPAHGNLRDLLDEWSMLRRVNLAFLLRLPTGVWNLGGTANGHYISVRGLAYVLSGHLRHHLNVLQTRYL